MKTNLRYFLILMLFGLRQNAQQLTLPVKAGGCQPLKSALYCYGLKGSGVPVSLGVYRLNASFQKTDSVEIPLAKGNLNDYVSLYSDTLHNFLNIYIQKKEKNAVTIFRFSDNMTLMETVADVEAGRLNNTAMLGSEPLYYGRDVYTLRSVADTNGRQFFLNKYTLKAGGGNFDYEFRWQFPFERKHVHSARILLAGDRILLLSATLNSGPKAGTWLLKINTTDGRLIKATKLNAKGDAGHYMPGSFYFDPANRSITLSGQKLSETQFNTGANTLALANASAVTLYAVEVDSLGEVTSRQDLKIPIAEIKSGVKNTGSSYILRTGCLRKESDGNLTLETDVFRAEGQTRCFRYCNTTVLKLLRQEDQLVIAKNTISANIQLEAFYATKDRFDINGRICADSLSEFESVFYRNLSLPVKQLFKTDANGNALWVLSKSNNKKNSVVFGFLVPVNKVYALKSIEELSVDLKPHLNQLSPSSFVISRYDNNGLLEIKLFNW